MALKVYRTPIAFHDAYVAAPSQKAALSAWGADKDLFARGMAGMVTDPALTAAPLARPGEIVKRLRASADSSWRRRLRSSMCRARWRRRSRHDRARIARRWRWRKLD